MYRVERKFDLPIGVPAQYAGRKPAASPATGLASRHKQQQDTLVAEALGLSA